MSIIPKILVVGVLAGFGLGLARPLAAQSLADVSKQEEARRKTLKEPAKVITNKDLSAVPAPAIAGSAAPGSGEVLPTPPVTAPAGQAPPAAGDQAAPREQTPAPPGPVKDQAYWSGRLKELQSQLDRDQTYIEAMQTRVNSLTADMTNRDDPAQRGTIASDRQKSLTELERLKGLIEQDKKAIADLSEEARRTGVPPGWLR